MTGGQAAPRVTVQGGATRELVPGDTMWCAATGRRAVLVADHGEKITLDDGGHQWVDEACGWEVVRPGMPPMPAPPAGGVW